jgi:c-di-GMP-binding flagellar brake protein YcgR
MWQRRQVGRQHQRAQTDFYINKIVGDEPHIARVRDISAGGMYLYRLLDPHSHPGEILGLEFVLPTTKEVIWAMGQVVRENSAPHADAVAIRFTRISEHHKELIRDFVHQDPPAEARVAA